MCGRFTLIADLWELALRFEFDGDGLKLESAYNVAPTQNVLTVVGGDTKRGAFMRWGLIPYWARDASLGNRMINARAETVAEKPAFRDALRKKRCLILADGFYEWQRTGVAKRPMRAVMRSGEPFAFAGLWSTWKGRNGDRISLVFHHYHGSERSAQADSRPHARDLAQGTGGVLAGRKR